MLALGVELQWPVGVLVLVPTVRPLALFQKLNLLWSPRVIEGVHDFLIATRAEPNRCAVAALDDEVQQVLHFLLLSSLYTLYNGWWCPFAALAFAAATASR